MWTKLVLLTSFVKDVGGRLERRLMSGSVTHRGWQTGNGRLWTDWVKEENRHKASGGKLVRH